nr:unconventional myosin-XV-like [Danaus plexippus plexippus]
MGVDLRLTRKIKARRQLYRLPGGAERVVNTRCATVVQDIVDDLCELIGVCNPAERAEFSLYCIVAGDSLTMPLAGDEYVLDVTTELQRAQHPFYLIFCRSVWHHPLRTDAPPLYTEVLFNQLIFYIFQHRLEILKADSSLKSKAKRNEWTWKAQTDVVKWQATPLRAPLLRLPAALAPPALECFTCIRAYCGDLQPPERAMHQDLTEVKCVYTVLMHCHSVAELRDEVYCQLMKQTTSNRSHAPDSCQRAWRLMSILSSYFTCSETLRPFLVEYLSAAAADRRRPCQGTAAVCLANFRKTMRCGGRKNVPSVEEVQPLTDFVVNLSALLHECLCVQIGVCNPAERAEFSLYCIVAGDSLTMPLAGDEYVLDVTTELQRAQHPFYLIFCRSVWHHPLRTDAPPLYTEVLFNQVAPDYLEGLLLVLPGGGAPAAGVLRDAAVVAALLHRAAGLPDAPHPRDLKFLLPKPLLALKEPRPNKWASWVGNEWPTVRTLSPAAAKSKVLQVLSRWSLFGSSFFAVRRVQGGEWREHVLALNRRGLHLLHPATHDTDAHWPYADLISTRKVRSEDGTLFLDVKCGSLLQQRVTRLQAEQAHEIARLIRQYIALQRDNREGDSRHSPAFISQ